MGALFSHGRWLVICLFSAGLLTHAAQARDGGRAGGAGGKDTRPNGNGGPIGSAGGTPPGSKPPRIAELRISQDKENAKILNTQAVEFTRKLIDFGFLLPDAATGGTVLFSGTRSIATTSNYSFVAKGTASPAYLVVKSCDANRLSGTDFAALFNRVGNTAYLNTTASPQCHLVDTRVDFLSANRTTNKLLVQATTQVETNSGSQPQVLQAELDTPAACVEDTGDMTEVTFGAVGAYGDEHVVLRAVRDAIAANNLPYQGLGDQPILMATNGSGSGNRWTAGTPLEAQMTEICKILGYREFVSADCHEPPHRQYTNGRCNFSSPSDNVLQSLNVATKTFSNVPAQDKYQKNWLARITCRSRLTRCP